MILRYAWTTYNSGRLRGFIISRVRLGFGEKSLQHLESEGFATGLTYPDDVGSPLVGAHDVGLGLLPVLLVGSQQRANAEDNSRVTHWVKFVVHFDNSKHVDLIRLGVADNSKGAFHYLPDFGGPKFRDFAP